ncbi:MAG: lamin tail domain-containing protein [Candidatus Sumerlaeaceae bacterium]|nr:lamin tail domain-containing protein [Candidatus Sumerlaeaceae bacterium]
MRITHGARGSSFILVLALLTLLVFLAAVLSYTSRLEALTSGNYAKIAQARESTATGLPAAMKLARGGTSVTTILQPWHQALAATTQKAPARSANARTTRNMYGDNATTSGLGRDVATMLGTGLEAAIAVDDLCSKVNVNAIQSERAFEKFLSAALSGASGSMASGAQTRAQGLFEYRGGRNGAVDTGNPMLDGTKTSNEPKWKTEPDLRKAPPEGVKRFETVQELRQSRRTSPQLFTDKEMSVLGRYVTVFSQSPEVLNKPDGSSLPKLPMEGITAHSVYLALRQAFPEKDPRLLMQFAANVMDYYNPDGPPTVITDPRHPQPWNALFGVKPTPLITEIYPRAMGVGENSTQGQFVEIYNPWGQPMSLVNWRLAIAATNGATGGVTLNAVLPPGGYLIVTNNYDKPDQKDPAETGSFLSIFGARQDGGQKKVVTDAGFRLPEENSFVALIDNNGGLIDVFSYTDVVGHNTKKSYQRDDPRVRSFEVGEATPFEKPGSGIYHGTAEAEMAMRKAFQSDSQETSSPVDMLRISTAYAGLRANGERMKLEPHGWQMPEYLKSVEPKATNFDVSLVDVFTTVKPPKAEGDETSGAATLRTKLANLKVGQKIIEDYEKRNSETVTTGTTYYAYGRLNVNTCAKVAYFSLDGLVDGTDFITASVVDGLENFRQKSEGQKTVPFLNTSDFLLKVFPDKLSDSQFAAAAKLLDQVTVSSSSFNITAENRADSQPGGGNGVRPSLVRMNWMVALDRQPLSLIGFSTDH